MDDAIANIGPRDPQALRFLELSLKATHGELSAAEKTQLDELLAQRPELRADLDWDDAFHARLGDRVATLPAMPGWERTARILAAESPATQPQTAAPEIGILDRLGDSIATIFGVRFNLQGLALALVLAQAGIIGMLAWQDRGTDYSEIRGGNRADVVRGPVLRVSFRPEVTEAASREAITAVNGEIVGGPGQLGIYLIRVKDLDLESAARRLRESGTTVLVEIFEPKR